MSIEKGAREVLFIFDIIKARLNELLINGVENFYDENLEELNILKEKLLNLKLNLIADLLNAFLEHLENQDKQKIAKYVLRIISATRMVERVMSMELIKKDLLNWMEIENAKSSN